MILQTVLTIAVILLLVGVLWVGLVRISRLLESIGGMATSSPASLLARIRWGVRAIERQTQEIGPQARRLTEETTALGDAMHELRRRIVALRGRTRT